MFSKVAERFQSRYDAWERIDVVFIVSTGRTATKFFAGFFEENFEGLVARHEPAPDLFDLGVDYIRDGHSFQKACAQVKYYRHALFKELAQKQASIYLESNNNAALLLPVIKAVFPRHKFVFITRDPKSYLVSAYSKKHGAPGYSLYGEDDPRSRLTAKDFAGDRLGPLWDQIGRFEKLCWHWKKYNQLIDDQLDDSVDHITLKYEDLFGEENFQSIKKLVDFVGLAQGEGPSDRFYAELMTKKSNETKSYQLMAFERWDAQMKKRFYDILGRDIERYGYS